MDQNPMKNQALRDQKQRGSAIIWILVLIALFAALSFVVAQGGRSSMSTVSDTQAKLIASEIISSGEAVRNAVKTLAINGCTESQISFANNAVSGYNNASAPSNQKCHVFASAGGGLAFPETNPEAFAQTNMTQTNYGKPMFHGMAQVVGMGKDCANAGCNEILMSIGDIKPEICKVINSQLGLETPPDENVSGWTWTTAEYFTGSYSYDSSGTGAIIGNETGTLANKAAGCMLRSDLGNSPGYYEFYQVVYSR